MPIYNKDGTIFKLNGINPLMKFQDHWKGSVVRVSNFEFKEVVLKDPMFAVDDRIPEDVPIAAVIGVGVIKDTTLLYCLPMIFTEIEDDVYGEKHKIPTYGDKFTFEAVMVDYTGVSATFFCTLPQGDSLLSDSIFFVLKERQWWKLKDRTTDGDGTYFHCVLSDIQPSFV